ncbi:hypothetical protein GGQ92_002998 [Gracilibacillus halotolerans]|uniref:Uncharacterized protein n=1 Tax=Gracilibacillus halotolerans TaxID=74386 RepID=A0A841RQS2_9BACI|nr:hypothetical protein [Gracilibacillus halotolerans]MBB6514177.1 hypothetical protein [Gracilibacillus halotolerans]
MKKVALFSVSFILVFILLQLLSGLFFTLTYTPDLTGIMSAGYAQETTIITRQQSIMPSLLMAVLAAPIAYFIMKKVTWVWSSAK